MILFIDSTDFNQVIYALIGEKIVRKPYNIDPHKSHEMLGFLEKFLKAAKVQSGDIKKIIACKGPGSYTGTRVGVTHAQALGFAWNVPVKFIAKEKIPKDLSKLR